MRLSLTPCESFLCMRICFAQYSTTYHAQNQHLTVINHHWILQNWDLFGQFLMFSFLRVVDLQTIDFEITFLVRTYLLRNVDVNLALSNLSRTLPLPILSYSNLSLEGFCHPDVSNSNFSCFNFTEMVWTHILWALASFKFLPIFSHASARVCFPHIATAASPKLLSSQS